MEIQPPDNPEGDDGGLFFDGSGPFLGGSAGGPPPADAIFASFSADDDETPEVPETPDDAPLSLGLKFFGDIKNLGG